MTEAYAIEGMHCGSCVAKINDALQSISVQATVTLNPPKSFSTKAGAIDFLSATMRSRSVKSLWL